MSDLKPCPFCSCEPGKFYVVLGKCVNCTRRVERCAPLSLSAAVEAVGLAMQSAPLAEVNAASLDVQEFAQQEKINRPEGGA